jgi:hypothetical protein
MRSAPRNTQAHAKLSIAPRNASPPIRELTFMSRPDRARIIRKAHGIVRGGYLKVYRLNRKTVKIAAAAFFCAAVAIPSARALSIPALAIASRSPLAQADTDSGDDDDKDIPPAQVDKYINVNLAMQKNHSLTVEQAASQQGMTVAQFRTLEGKIERDDTLRERVRTALRKAANPNATDAEQ